jgi:cobalt/nickel transport system permease protein
MGTAHAHALYVHGHSRLHRLPAHLKVASAVSFVVTVAVTPRRAVWAFGIYVVALALLAAVSRIRVRFVLVRMVAILPFIAFAFLMPLLASGEQVEVLGVELSVDGLWAAWNIVAKAGLGAATSVLLAATTEVPDLLAGLNRLRLPAVFVSVAGFMIRYLELIAEDLGRMRVAMVSRGYRPRGLWHARPLAASAGTLFVRSYERGERIHDAMRSRGFTGTMPNLRHSRPSPSDWVVAGSLPALGLIVLVTALIPA